MEVKYFMWGFQHYFLGIARHLFKDLCELIGCDLKPSLFLVGFLQGNKKGFLPICVEPENCSFQPEDFEAVVANAKNAAEAPRQMITISPSEWHAKDHEKQYQLGCLASAVFEAVKAKTDPNRTFTYCTRMVRVENYLVSLVIQIDRTDHDSWPHLSNEVWKDGRVHVSLIDCLIDEFLNICADDLSKPEPGRWLTEVKDRHSIVRAAGRSFMYKASAAGDEFYGLHGLFEACNRIASLRYEGTEGAGTIVIARKDHPAIDWHLVFANPVKLADYRACRKLLELCRGPLALICDSHVIRGLGEVSDRYDLAEEGVYKIRFAPEQTWEFAHASQVLMRTSYGNPSLPQEKFNSARFRAMLARVIPNIAMNDIDRLDTLARKASDAKHGTILVISPKAKEEATRLERQGTRVEPITLTAGLLGLVSTIDGAVVMTPSSVCYGIGVILDGRATQKGTPSRGARYNSAVRYIEQEKDCVAVVVSEDGMINILPDLLPQIQQADVEGMMQRLHSLSSAAAPGEGEYYAVMDWLDKHRFYLSNSVCDEINRLWKSINDRLNGEGARIVYRDFKPNPEMSESFFIE